MSTAAVILAAGSSARFGSPKQEVRIGGRRMLDLVADAAREAGLEPIIAVVPPSFAVAADIAAVVNEQPEAGISRSLRLGIGALAADVEAAVILLGDEPLIEPESVLEVALAGEEGATVVAMRSGDRIGPPVFLRRERFDIVDAATGDQGLGPMLRNLSDLVTVDVDRPPIDVDTPADLDLVAPACPGCGARVPAPAGTEAHAYIGASPGCWLRWTELHGGGLVRLGRQANDAYAAQHPGVDGRRQRQSVAVHLIALCHWLDHGITDPRLTEITQRILADRPDWPWLTPPGSYRLTIHDLSVPAGPDDTLRWVEAVWEAWSAHHATVRGWAAEALR